MPVGMAFVSSLIAFLGLADNDFSDIFGIKLFFTLLFTVLEQYES